jgi:hypothetical protein
MWDHAAGLALLASVYTLCQAHSLEGLEQLYSENVDARLWRTALRGAPQVGGRGWPSYTYGAHNNTPILPDDPDHVPGTYANTSASGWTAGFFPNSLWQLYDRKKNLLPNRPPFPQEPSLEDWLATTQAWTSPLDTNRNLTATHDLGFLAQPFESALRLAPSTNSTLLPILADMSNNLAARFVAGPGVIRSWDNDNSSVSQTASHADSVLVIIDNMMNLGLLARSAASYTHNASHLALARSHADITMRAHVRPDGSTFHVCDFSATTGALYLCRTAQGLSDTSTWARGQAWAIYGFAEMFAATGDEAYLRTATRCAEWFIRHLPADGTPFWDFSDDPAPGITPRDSSAAMIAANGMLLVQDGLDTLRPLEACVGRNFRDAAVALLRATTRLALAREVSFAGLARGGADRALGACTGLATPAGAAVSRGFEAVLMHATANRHPGAGRERSFDHGLVYGDAYFIEAGNRLLQWRQRA